MNHEPVINKRQLLEYMQAGCKPSKDWRIGVEHEKFAYRLDDLRPPSYEGERGVCAILESLTGFGWEPKIESGKIIALTKQDSSAITLEPGGQIELSGAPMETIHQTCMEAGEHLIQVKTIASKLGLGFIGLGHQPKWRFLETPWMPKARYDIMRGYMPKQGGKGLEMMLATCTIQVNLDFSSEERMVKMFRVALALQPVATALFANSPFKEGKPSGFLSYRGHIWADTDPDRCGGLPFVFEDGFGFERYVDYMLDVPAYFVRRQGRYINAAGQSFRDFMKGKLPALPGELPVIDDWIDHLTIVFPEVRLKQFLEMRGADGGPFGRICALPAFWAGLLYDDDALDAAWRLVKDWTKEERAWLLKEVPRLALKTPFRGSNVKNLAADALMISRHGLRRRARLDNEGLDESRFLAPLLAIAETGITPAEEMLDAYATRWQGNIDPVFMEYAY